MKLLFRNIFFAVFMLTIFSGCEKEYSIEGLFDTAGTTGGTSSFTLLGSPNLCTVAQVSGTYTAGTATTAANNVVIQVDVTVLGTYTITTNATNGMSFAGAGTFTTLGSQFIQLDAVGTPTATGVYNYQAGSVPCSFPVTVGGGSGGTAVFNFNGSPNACTTPTINGTYTQGTALTATNTVVLTANVTTAGTYNLSTSANGMTFTATGTFTITGNQNVTFTGTGTPINAGNINFSPGTTGTCSFTIPVSPTGGGALASFTFAGAPNACTSPVINGTYTQGTALTAANTVVLQLNVTTVGAYTISATNNDMTFSANGNFTSTGAQTVTLIGSGTPTNAGAINFTPTGATAPGCTFTIPVLPGGGGGNAAFTLAGSPNACTAPVINGTYTQGMALTSANTVVLQVNVTTAGNYGIGATANGMNFTATGTFTTTGPQTVTLTGSGTPTASGAINLTPTGTSGSACTFTITVQPGGGGGAAAYTFSGAPNACTAPVINGTYTQGTALTGANTVVLQVNVTTPGTYSITATANGMTFSRSGTFTATGMQTVTLNGSGTPTASGAINFTPTGAPGAGCTFTVTVGASGPTVFIRATINGIAYEFNSSIQTLDASGQMPSGIAMLGTQSLPAPNSATLEIDFVNEAATIATGSFANFATGTNETRYIDAYYTNNSGVDFTTNDAVANSFTGVLSTLTASGASGTFQGTLIDTAGNTVTVTNGSFNITF